MGNGRSGQIRSLRDWRLRPWQKAQFKKHWHFCRTDFAYDEWLCRVCDRFNSNPSGKPVLYLKRDAIQHETTSEHQYFVNQYLKFATGFPKLLKKLTDLKMGWGPIGDLLSPDEVFETLRWDAPDVRKGVDFVNQFVTFWAEDVAAASAEGGAEEPGRNMQEEEKKGIVNERATRTHCRRPTFADFFERIVIEPLVWDFPSNNIYDGGWGTPVAPVPNANTAEMDKKKRNGADGTNWVPAQRNGRGGRRGRGKGKARNAPQRNPDTTGKNIQVASQNLFAQLQLVDGEE